MNTATMNEVPSIVNGTRMNGEICFCSVQGKKKEGKVLNHDEVLWHSCLVLVISDTDILTNRSGFCSASVIIFRKEPWKIQATVDSGSGCLVPV